MITVVISAFNASLTIKRAVGSALAQTDVQRLILVDDASGDDTIKVAKAAADGSPRLQIVRNEVNLGPAASRNRAFTMVNSEAIAILDADDWVAPNRFRNLLRCEDWDFIADNIRFTNTTEGDAEKSAPVTRTRKIDLEEFALRNISRPGHAKGELGFLKPLIKTEFIRKHDLRYDETLKLGEDFIFYASALAEGARFRIADTVGYVAFERPNSLSARHRTADLKALARSGWNLIDTLPPGPAREAMCRYNHAVEVKARHRSLLDERRQFGAATALMNLCAAPKYVPGVFAGILRDKLAAQPPAHAHARQRLLFDSSDFEDAAAIRNGNGMSG